MYTYEQVIARLREKIPPDTVASMCSTARYVAEHGHQVPIVTTHPDGEVQIRWDGESYQLQDSGEEAVQ